MNYKITLLTLSSSLLILGSANATTFHNESKKVTATLSKQSNVTVKEATSTGDTVYPSWANGAWIYDNATYPRKPTSADQGSQAQKIIAFNQALSKNSGVTEIYSYGSDIELVDTTEPKTGWAPCSVITTSADDPTCQAFVWFGASTTKEDQYNGARNLDAYRQAFTASTNNKIKYYEPVIDGRTNTLGVDAAYLKAFNDMSPAYAQGVADKVAAQVCAPGSHASGIQFDIEPFNIPDTSKPDTQANGQTYFYQAIAKDFASSKFHCVNAEFPKGRFFSVFTFANHLNKDVARIFNQYHNGYVIDSLYDLGPDQLNRAGKFSTLPNDYKTYVNDEIHDIQEITSALNIHFQVGIPVSASAHEFAQYQQDGDTHYPKHSKDGSELPHVKQSEYLAEITNSPNFKSLMANPLCVGVSVWAFADFNPWKPMIDGSKVQRFYLPYSAKVTADSVETLNQLLPINR